MWSGPRNISTAMMRAFENRPDTDVWDEPMYGHYLSQTGIKHPGATEVIADQGTDWQDIAKRCQANSPNNMPVFYQKHMTMHLLPNMSRTWLDGLSNCFLIRHPDQVVASYGAVRADLTLEDIGFVQQAELFEYVVESSEKMPLVIDSRDFLLKPQQMLALLCESLDIPFFPEMLSWPAGQRDSDGVWGNYWYDSVWKSTGFAEYRDKPANLSTKFQAIADAAFPYYQKLHEHRLRT
jgi:hypothetical protein